MVAATQKPARKAASRRASKSLVSVKTKSGLVLGYARHLARIRPGVDLTKPTFTLGK
jgi:hypothetical protein